MIYHILDKHANKPVIYHILGKRANKPVIYHILGKYANKPVIYHILGKRANNYTTNSVFLNTWCWQMTNSLVWGNCYEMSYKTFCIPSNVSYSVKIQYAKFAHFSVLHIQMLKYLL
jgi:hypothetical protein